MSSLIQGFRTLLLILLTALSIGTSANADSDHSSPESTLAAYIGAIRTGDVGRVLDTFADPKNGFNLPEPIPISTFQVTRRTVYGLKRVEKWNTQGITPQARVGDVELQVLEIIDGKKEMYSYNFRKVDGRWKIYSFALWGAD